MVACAGTPFKWEDARQIKMGMTENEVERIMGRPFRLEAAGGKRVATWSYSNILGANRAVTVTFKGGVVIGITEIPERSKD